MNDKIMELKTNDGWGLLELMKLAEALDQMNGSLRKIGIHDDAKVIRDAQAIIEGIATTIYGNEAETIEMIK
jgi:hypothetical protein